MVPMVRRLWCWLFHEKIAGFCLRCLKLTPISGGQDFPFDPGGLSDFASSLDVGAGLYDPSSFATAPPPVSSPSSGLSDFAAGVGPGAAAPSPGAPPPPSGLDRFAAGLGKEVSDSPLKAFATLLGVGSTGLGIANQFNVANQQKQQTALLTQAEKNAQAAAAPAVAFGTQQLQQGQAGKLPQPMQDAVTQWTQQAKAAIRAQYGQMGLGNSSDIASAESNIDLMAQSMIAQLLQSQEQIGLAGVNTGVSAATGTAQIAQQQQQLLTNLIATANAQLGQLASRSA